MSPAGTIDVWTVRALSAQKGRAAGRAALRMVLSSYLDVDPVAIRFDRSSRGRPSVRGSGLHFSFSDSGDRALVAVSRTGPVGVDVERFDPRRPVRRIARRWFAPAEVAVLDRLPRNEEEAAFYRCWSAKEAYAKGMGEGLAIGFDTFSVAGLVKAGCDRVRVDGWEVRSLDLGGGYTAAVAAPGSEWRHERLTWNRAS